MWPDIKKSNIKSLFDKLCVQKQFLVSLFIASFIFYFRIGERTFHGDEIWSLKTVNEIYTSLHSAIYFIFLKAWSLLGLSEGWLRGLSATFGILCVAFNFIFWKRFLSGRIAFATSLLLATSPFLIVYAQQIRFYTIFLFGSYFSFWYALKYLESSRFNDLIKLLVTHIFLFFTHGISGLLLASVLVGILFATPKISSRTKWIIIAMGFFISLLALQSPVLRNIGFDLFAKYTNAVPEQTYDRHLNVISFLKFPLTFYVFSLGQAVYPFSILSFVLLLTYAGFFIRGVLKSFRNKTCFIVFSTVILFSSASLYLLFDVLCPSSYASAAPRYLIFLLPVFYFFVVSGFFEKGYSICLVLLLTVNAVSLSQYWNRQWSYGDDLINWRNVTHQLENYVDSKTTIFLDGRSFDIAKWYFPKNWVSKSLDSSFGHDLNSYTVSEKIIIISFDFHKKIRSRTTQAIRDLAKQYAEIAMMAKYPLIIYVFEKAISIPKRQGSISFPKEIYGLEFQDINFPVTLNSPSKKLISTGIAEVTDEMSIKNPKGGTLADKNVGGLTLFSNVISRSRYPQGKVLVTLTLFYEDRSTQSLEIRKGIETNQWDESCHSKDCSVAFSWIKRIAFLGSQRYPQSAKHFTANVFAYPIRSNKSTRLLSIKIKNLMPDGIFYIWGIGTE